VAKWIRAQRQPVAVIAATAQVYIDAYETITGQKFALVQPEIPVLDRIRANLKQYF